MHHGNIFSFSSNEELDRAQESRRLEKLRVDTGFEEKEEEEEEASNNNMLSEMFNYAAGHADVLAAAASGGGVPHETTNQPLSYHRLIQQIRPDFYGGANSNRPQGLLMTAATAINSSNWNSSSPPIHQQQQQHRINNPSPAAAAADSTSSSSPSTAMQFYLMNPSASGGAMHHHHHHHQHHEQNQAFLGGASLMFGEGIRESQVGPSLSLSSPIQRLEMRKAEEVRGGSAAASALLFYNSQQQQQQQQLSHESCEGSQYQQQQELHMASSYGSMSTGNVLIRNSKYARAAQELLEEFCSVSRGHVRGINTTSIIIRTNSSSINHQPTSAPSSSSSKDIHNPLLPADRFQNQRNKSKFLSMLDEVERRYNHYCEQMQMVVNSFDSVMGFGAALPYTSLARKAMSRHFRCLKDAIAAQLKRTCEILGENDGGSGSALTKGETPKLRLIDQTLRQQRAFHQIGMIEQEAWRPQRGLPDRSVTILRSWLFEHFLHPYPSDADKHLLARKTGLSRNQVSNWFINARVRLWKPMVEDMYQQEAKEEENSPLNEAHQTSCNTTPHTHTTVLIATEEAPTTQHQHQPQHQPQQSPESDAPPETVISSNIVSRPQLDYYANLRFDAHTLHDQPPPPPHHYAASNSLIFPPPSPDDDHHQMYRRAAATAPARTGDLSLTLGLRHAGANAPDTAR